MSDEKTIDEKLVKEQALPQLAILQAEQRNMFTDVFLQDIGHIILGTAFVRNPELNDPKYYADTQFTPEEHNKHWNEYEIVQQHIWCDGLSSIMQNLDLRVNDTAAAVKEILEDPENKLVAGTMRMHISIEKRGDIFASLILIRKKPNASVTG